MKAKLTSILLILVLLGAVSATPAHAYYAGSRLTGCGTSKETMRSVRTVNWHTMWTVKLTRQWDWCRDLTCYFFYPVPCYYGTARVNNVVTTTVQFIPTSWCVGCDLHVDQMTEQYGNRIEGGNWGYHSDHLTVAQFHVSQCIDLWLVHQCTVKKSYSWGLRVNGAAQHYFNWSY